MKLKRKLILCLVSISILIANIAIEGCATAQTNYEDVEKTHGTQKQLTMLQKKK